MEPRDYPVTGTLRLRVRMRSGDVRIAQTSDANATVQAKGERDADEVWIEHDATAADTRLEVTQRKDGWGFRSRRVHVSITVPVGAIVDVGTGSGDVTVSGLVAGLTVQSASGDMTIERVHGEGRLRSASGDVHVEEVGGDLTVTTASGEIEVGSVAGRFEARTASGDIDVGATAGSTHAVSASGDVTIGSAGGDVSLRSVSGDIMVGVPSGTRVWLDVSSTSGDTRSDLDPGSPDTAGKAAFEIRASSVSGDIRIRRARAAGRGTVAV